MTPFLPALDPVATFRLAGLIAVQIAVVVITAWGFAAKTRLSAARRHAIWLAALAGVLLGPAELVAVDRFGWSLRTVPAAEPVERRTPSPTSPPAAEDADVPATMPTPRSGAMPTTNNNSTSPKLSAASSPAPPGPELVSFNAATAARIVVGVWGAGAVLMFGRLVYGLVVLARLRRTAWPIDEGRTAALLAGIAREVGLKATPTLLVSDRLSGPVAAGVLRPTIALPETLAADVDDDRLHDVLVHEAAHLARWDPLVGIVQRVASALFWPHPLVHGLNRALSRAREEVCDNYVLRGGGRARYARTLVDLAESIEAASPVLAAAGLLPPRWNLADRVTGLLDERRDLMIHVNRRTLVGLAALMLLVAAPFSIFGPVRTVAASPTPVSEDPTKPPAAEPPVDPGPITDREIAGRVVDAEGRAIAGARVMAWSWVPAYTTTTGADGRFRFRPFVLKAADPGEGAEIRVVKEGYASREFPTIKGGTADLVVTLSSTTSFQGVVTDLDHRPTPDARVRMGRSHRRDGREIGRYWSETRADAQGRYRLHVPPDDYDVQVRVPGRGVVRKTGVTIAEGATRTLDLPLERGADFRARVVDSLTGKPVAGVRLWHWQHPGIEARSDADGLLVLDGMPSGRFDFMVDSPGIERKDMGEIRLVGPGPWLARWWSEQAVSGWNRRSIDDGPRRAGWQRNFDHLDYDLKPGMERVEIVVERGVVVRGRVLDPDGRPVAGATVAPALTGTGNSLTGDTRFSVTTGPDGRYEALLPAGNDFQYNLVAHDGAYMEWRTWANGVIDPFKTTPGDVREDVDIHLTRPAVVRGRVVDSAGKPVVGRQVRASAGDYRENRYYDPTTSVTDAEGRFELKFIRPIENLVQVAPFWLRADQAPSGTSETVHLKPGEIREGIQLVAKP